MNNSWISALVLGGAALAASGCATCPDPAATREMAERMVSGSFTAPAPALLKRLEQDRSQQICSKIGAAKLTQEEAAEVVKLARASIRYPASGNLVGSWKLGDRLAHDGAGEQELREGRAEQRVLLRPDEVPLIGRVVPAEACLLEPLGPEGAHDPDPGDVLLERTRHVAELP